MLKIKKVQLIFTIAVFTFSVFVQLLLPYVANAKVGADPNPNVQLERWFFYRAMHACLETPDFNGGVRGAFSRTKTISLKEINGGHFIVGNYASMGYIAPSLEDDKETGAPSKGTGTNGDISCEDGSIWTRGATAFGFPKVINLICAMNRAPGIGNEITPDPEGGMGRNDCEKTQHNVKLDGGSQSKGTNKFQTALTWALENEGNKMRPYATLSDNKLGGDKGYSSDALKYLLGYKSLINFCGPLDGNLDNTLYESDSATGNKVVAVRLLDDNAEISKKNTFYIGGKEVRNNWWDSDRDQNSSVAKVWYPGDTSTYPKPMTCGDMAKLTVDNIGAYQKWAKANPDVDTGGVVNAINDEGDDGDGGGTEETTSCAVEGVGWIVCPVLNFMADLNETAFGLISKLLIVEPKLLQDKDTDVAWRSFRDIANALFVIAFLIIIYSQITGGGFSNYGIKKMLPRLIIAAVLVNVSFILCQLAVDISNIVGSSIYQFFDGIATTSGENTNTTGWKEVTATILVAGTALIAALLLLMTIGTAALLAVMVALVILLARKAVLILLVVISPLAFVAYLLPNTESWFKKWWKMFYTLLLVFPIIGIVFGASTLASRIINNASAGDTPVTGYIDNGKAIIDDTTYLKLVALGIMAVPLFAIPTLLKSSMAGLGAIGSKLNGGLDRSMSAAGGHAKRRAESLESKMAANEGKGALGKMGRFAGGYRARRKHKISKMETDTARAQELGIAHHTLNDKKASARDMAEADAVVQSRDAEEAGHISALMTKQAIESGKNPTEVLQDRLNQAIANGKSQEVRAAMQALEGQTGGVTAIQKSLSDNQSKLSPELQGDIKKHVIANAGTYRSKDARVFQWAAGDEKGTLDKLNAAELTDSEVASQSAEALASHNGTLGKERAKRITENGEVMAGAKEAGAEELHKIANGP